MLSVLLYVKLAPLLQAAPPIVAEACVLSVMPPGFETSMVTYFTSILPVSTCSVRLIFVTVPISVSKVLSSVTSAVSPT